MRFTASHSVTRGSENGKYTFSSCQKRGVDPSCTQREVNAPYFTSVGRQINSKSFVHDVKSSVGDAVAHCLFLSG